jgi:hypothetical protein
MATFITEPENVNPTQTDWNRFCNKLNKLAISISTGVGTNSLMEAVAAIKASARGFICAGITNFNVDEEPFIMVGSRFEMGGCFYECPNDEQISGWKSILTGSTVYVYAVPKGESVNFRYKTTLPIWNAAKKGWYDGDNRALFVMTKKGSSIYANKNIIGGASPSPLPMPEDPE